jgi:hypothetical protein
MKTHFILFLTLLAASISCSKIEPTIQNETQLPKTFKADFKVVTPDSSFQFNKEIELSDEPVIDTTTPVVAPNDENIISTRSNARTNANLFWSGSFTNEPINKTVTLRIDVDHDCWLRWGKNDALTAQNISMYIENVKALYAPIGVKVAIKEMYIAHVPESFPNTNAGLARAGYGEKVWQLPVTTGIKIYITNKNIGGAANTAQLNGPFAYCVAGLANAPVPHNVSPTWNTGVYNIAHEIGHNMGSKHTFWGGHKWRPGTFFCPNADTNSIGQIDSTFAGERQTGTCNYHSGWKSVAGGGTIMSYGHVTPTGVNFSKGFGILPAAAIRNGVYNSTIPFDAPQPTLCTSWTYSAWSPCINGTQMRTAVGVPSGCVGIAPDLTRSCEMVQVKLPIQSYVTTGVTHLGNVAARAFDGNSTLNDNRWVTSGATSTMTMNMANRHCKQLRLWTGFFDKGVWGFAIKSVKVIADDVVVGTYPGSLFFQLDLNLNIQSLRLEFTGDSHVRIREIEVWGW